jgi:hypothetical protein
MLALVAVVLIPIRDNDFDPTGDATYVSARWRGDTHMFAAIGSAKLPGG